MHVGSSQLTTKISGKGNVVFVRHKPRKRFGQHFLTDQRTADRFIQSAGLAGDDTVLEIGPGKGILTERLLRCVKHVTAVEIDRDLVALLKDRFTGIDSFRLIEADILSVDLESLFGDFGEKIKVVSNLPFNISTPVIEMLIKNRKLVSDAVLFVQKEVASRLIAEPDSKDYGLTTLNLALYARCSKVMDVNPGSFSPPPEVMSSVIAISFDEHCRYALGNERLFRDVTGAAFRMRRKMIRNTLVPYMVAKGVTGAEADSILADAGIDPRSRPENLHVSSFVAVSNSLGELIGRRENGR